MKVHHIGIFRASRLSSALKWQLSPLTLHVIIRLPGRLGEPEEVAGLVEFLALDPAASYITGQVHECTTLRIHLPSFLQSFIS